MKIWIILGALVVLGGGYWIFSKNAQPAENVVLGVIAGTTGQYASAGEGYVKGFNTAMDAWNANNAQRFSAIMEDDGFEAQKGLAAYKKLKELDGVNAYAVLSSFSIDAIYDQAHVENKPIALGFEQSKPAEDDNIFQILPAARPVQSALGAKVKELGYKKPMAAVSNNTSVYQNFYEGFKEGFGMDVRKFDIGGDIGSIRSQALAISAAKPDVVAFFMAPKDSGLLVKELLKITNADSRPYFVFDQSIQSGARDFQEVLGSEISKIDGSLVSLSKNDPTEAFISAFKEKYNDVPPFGADMGYNSFMLLATTYDADPEDWIQKMKQARFTGADGEVFFSETGLRMPTIGFGKLKDGVVVVE